MLKKLCKVNFTLSIVLICISNVFGIANENYGKITGEINLSLKEEKISAKLKYDYVAVNEPETEIKFYFDGSFNFSKVKCRNCQSFKFDREAKPLPTLTIILKETLPKDGRLSIEIDYDGSLKDMFNKEHSFLELGLDWFWYPVHRNIGQVNFLYRLNVKTDVPDYQLVSNGNTTRKGKGWLIESKVPDYDINIVLSNDLLFKNYNQNGYDLQVVAKNLPEATSTILLNNIKDTLDFFNATFGTGSPQREVTAVIRPFQGTDGQGGYFRKGYFILPKIENAEDFFFPVAHELAHSWWIGANQQNAWLNESFAEYSAMLATRKLKGMTDFNKILEKKKKLNVNLPPIYNFDRTKNRQQTPMVLYVKGTLKLHELENDLGEEKFMGFLKKILSEKVVETDKLVELLAKFSSSEVADRFLARLKA